ncbi:MAG TPA: bifunctional serine/threonine-protein kinase/formylglycine-generating enzyme family protein [Planctomycetota bacterium]|nr:bifunctional serine/threonine-protein kinase/formylglycine-generating enzyme family protein [Planctomycetota bacterium]
MTPFRCGRYMAGELLGSGGSGSVFRGKDEQGREVALKVIMGQADPAWRARFDREAAIGRSLDHPGIVKVLDVLEHNGRPVLVMELLRGRSLRAEMTNGPIPEARALELVEKIARALHHAHEKGLVHRDMKPDNVLLRGPSDPVIMDFGIAKHVDAATLTASGGIIGTPSYISPEQVRGEVRDLDARCDVWALGVLLYEMLAGELPFERGRLVELLKAIAEDEPRPIPGPAGALALRALAKDREDRPESALAFAEACAAIRRGAGAGRVRKAWLAAPVVVVGALLLAWRPWGAPAPPVPAPPPPPPVETVKRPPPPAPPVDQGLPPRLHAKGRVFTWDLPGDAGTLELVPVSSVAGKRLWIGRTEVTRAQYLAFCRLASHEPPEDPPWSAPLADEPVVNVSWQDATDYCSWAGLALPTAEEWDRAAYGTSDRRFPWGDADPDPEKCVTADTGATRPLPVGGRVEGASAAGALDMVGNVWEWCQDVAPDLPDREFPNRLLKGGSYAGRTADRERTEGDPPMRKRADSGFRVALAR